jgi:hypothetical protein
MIISNRHFWHEAETTADPAAIWALWMDVARWGEWDQGLAAAELHGSIRTGASGIIIDLQGRRSPFSVTTFDSGRAYAFATRLPFGALLVERTIIAARPCRFRHEVRFTGVGGWLLAPLLGPGFRTQLPPTMAALARLAEGCDQ